MFIALYIYTQCKSRHISFEVVVEMVVFPAHSLLRIYKIELIISVMISLCINSNTKGKKNKKFEEVVLTSILFSSPFVN